MQDEPVPVHIKNRASAVGHRLTAEEELIEARDVDSSGALVSRARDFGHEHVPFA